MWKAELIEHALQTIRLDRSCILVLAAVDQYPNREPAVSILGTLLLELVLLIRFR